MEWANTQKQLFIITLKIKTALTYERRPLKHFMLSEYAYLQTKNIDKASLIIKTGIMHHLQQLYRLSDIIEFGVTEW